MSYDELDLQWLITFYVLAIVGHLKNVSPTFGQMSNRITNVEVTNVTPTIANTIVMRSAFTQDKWHFNY